MEDKKIIEEKLKRFEELLEKLERISDEKQHHHHKERLHEGPHHKKRTSTTRQFAITHRA